ncbi:ATP-binding protein [Corynebacterium sp. 153RC1]|uniref:ATP-binding protein n=1 Tax=unclassified Corynebacterium TaxID=2624378 RepID=UPI00211B7E17|nr:MULTISPECIES: ATP-binding protein [unclassified Corynebacterium]MCQ9353227.1 ATP-binding protein [Corynebacterium sp. 209RC1]MCQ9355367.1 ATP-binding protein [Corynebacterium sp. 1222RC1]MCQ9357099.1 ATP-binding protein [Corynebacterium sp. 122RC1]MCQ9358908.1 ATP-binding protein [Corynebacterium sp. 142RC1]MCQ9360460.1 ATP-binding protein [Corynebacterium sp. 153RC1]
MTVQLRNPFRPTFGIAPLYWVGRADVLENFRTALEIGPGAFGRSMLISGNRGIGKTALLNELEDIAEQQGWVVLRTSGRNSFIKELVETTIPKTIADLDPPKQRRLSSVGLSSVGSVGFDVSQAETYKPSLNTRLRDLLALLTEAGVLITVDEVQDANPTELTELAVAFQDLLRDEQEIALVMTGLPQGIEKLLQLPGTTFMRRAQRFSLGEFSPKNAAEGFRATAFDSGITFSPEAVDMGVRISKGYPFLVQLVGALAWNQAHRRGAVEVSAADVAAVERTTVSNMGTQVHGPALRNISPAQRQFLDAMAKHDHDAVPISTIAATVGKRPQGVSDTREKLIAADLIESAGTGLVRFTLPYLREYLNNTDTLGRVD